MIREYFEDQDISFDFHKEILSQDLKRKIEQQARQSFYGTFVYRWDVHSNGKVIGRALLDNVLGKSLPITFLVIFDPEGTILRSAVVKYREPYGGGVQSKKWNSQFIGRNSESSYAVSKDISGISGATISVHSMSLGIRKLALLIKASAPEESN